MTNVPTQANVGVFLETPRTWVSWGVVVGVLRRWPGHTHTQPLQNDLPRINLGGMAFVIHDEGRRVNRMCDNDLADWLDAVQSGAGVACHCSS